MPAYVLLVEDEPSVRMIVGDLLQAAGYAVTSVATANEALRHALQQRFDLMVLDVMLPDGDGFSLCHKLRDRGIDAGILMLTARAQVADRVQGLKKGADDYLVKPFDSAELLARLEALLRRVKKEPLRDDVPIHLGNVEIDLKQATVLRAGERLNLAAKEVQLLRYLLEHPGEVLTRDRLLHQVWSQQPFITPRTVDTHVAWLRQKIEEDAANPRHILTVRGEGYRFHL